MSNRSWFYASSGQQQGPYPEAQLRDLMTRGTVGADTLVWTEGMSGWQRVAEIPGLMPAGGPPAIPPAGGPPPVAHYAPAPTQTTTVVEGGSFKFGTFIWIILGLVVPLWPITLPICWFLAYRSYKKPAIQTIHTITK